MTDATQPSRILMTDDDPVLLELGEATLASEGYDVVTAENGKEALAKLRESDFDMLVTDLEMPVMNGLELTAAIRADARLQNLPVMIVTGKDQTEAVDEAYAAGATSFLSKPLNWKLFARSVRFVHNAAMSEKALRVARDEAESAAKLKQAILANLNHEMRTPLNHIIGFGQVISQFLGASGHPDEKQYADHIVHGGQRLLKLTSDMVFLAAAETDGLSLDETEVSPQDTLRSVASTFDEQAEEKNITIHVASEAAKMNILADQKLTVMMLSKLVDNAIKFSPEQSTVTIGFTVHEETGRVIFFVRDQGPGIPEEKRAHIGKMFEQMDMDLSRANEGMGAGLKICSLIAEAHGGKVRFSNGIEGGLTVTASLPASRIVRRTTKAWA
ncbi:MAG: hybrid sensor histidine kinase/response regulator [Aquisalinus sp.]|nr:hybrid sensor histidine kinase/response regulator [Aquisalinus sp.]